MINKHKNKSILFVEKNDIKKCVTIDDFEKTLSLKFSIDYNLTSRGYIFPNGKNLALDSYTAHSNVLHFLIENGYVEEYEGIYSGGCPPLEDLGCIRTNLDSEGFVMLSVKEPTAKQYEVLLDFFDKYLNRKYQWRYGSDLMIFPSNQKADFVRISLTNKVSDDIVDIIKNYYRTGRIVESKKIENLTNIEAMYLLEREEEVLKEEKIEIEKDSQGNELTAEQSEFFKNSKVRDENNRLLVVYHGTSKQFDDETFKSSINWFTADLDYAKGFGTWTGKKGFNYQCYLSCSKIFDCGLTDGPIFGLMPIKPYRFSSRFESIFKKLNTNEKLIRNMIEEVANEFDEKENGYKMKINVLTRSSQFKDLLSGQGYDCMRCVENGNVTTFGVFNSNQIKKIDNKNPTNRTNINES